MRRIFVFAMYCFAMTVIACSDEDQVGGGDSQWFRQPEVTVDGTNVDVRCLALVGEGVLSAGRSGFVCLPSEGGSAVAVTVTDPVVEGTILRCRITGLTPRTHYMIYAYVELNGQRLIGQPAVFDTGEASVEPDDPENPDNPENPDKPDPDDPTPPGPEHIPVGPNCLSRPPVPIFIMRPTSAPLLRPLRACSRITCAVIPYVTATP